jgi:pyridoxal phosphate enzyme (YggS family)
LQWHCIGPIQSNKTRLVAAHFAWAQTVDRLKIAQRLAEQRPPGLPPLNVCIQVNVDGGANKSGVAPAEAPALARAILELPRLKLRGLMSIPEPADSFAAQLASHQRARELFDGLRLGGVPLDTLSMGMTDDLEAAIHAGSTMVRVGTAIFGRRDYGAA